MKTIMKLRHQTVEEYAEEIRILEFQDINSSYTTSIRINFSIWSLTLQSIWLVKIYTN
jgi:hypothetical protein